ncbi:hypothetical protein [Nonomuraea basaltis]|uniref:hypothetical protein n=1 Tax=Nonomuraea basaltis TaxID=2495887 RepID=UPI00110C4A4F|nr:hypothetical protein [Nonomuraea basaltis]TMR89492.1 hypothetical protein EJK15_60450 [Nonomuraea basaltis]
MFGDHIHTVHRNRTEPLEDDEHGVLRIIQRGRFSITTRDMVHAEFYTVGGKYGQVCKALRESGYYTRGQWLTGKVSTTPRHETIEAALRAALDELETPA